MALMTGEQYIESIKKIKMEIYMFGERYNNPTESPILRPSLNSVRMTYDLAQMPEYEDLMTVVSPYTGTRGNRFTHIHQSTDDLVKKVKDIPCAVGFGISNPEQAKKMAGQSDGVIVGSAIVKLCGQYGVECVPYVKEYVKDMKDAVREA